MFRTIFYTFWCVLCYYTVIIRAYRFIYITEFLSKILLFPEHCASSGLSQDHLMKNKIIKYGNILLGVHFTLRYSKLKLDY